MITDSRVLVLPSPTTSWSGDTRRRTRRPLVGVVFQEGVAGEEAFALDLAVAVHVGGGDVFGIGCSSPIVDHSDLVPALVRCREGGVEVLVTTVPVWRREPRPPTWPCRLAGLDVPFLQIAPSPALRYRSPSQETWPAPNPTTDHPGTAGLAGLALRTARLRRRSNAHKRVAIALPTCGDNEAHWKDAASPVTASSVLALLYTLRHAGFRVDRIPADADALFSQVPDRPRSPVSSGHWPVTSSSGPTDRVGFDLGGVLMTVGPPADWDGKTISTSNPTESSSLAFGRRLAEAWNADAVVHLGRTTLLQWLPRRGGGSLTPDGCDSGVGDSVTVIDLHGPAPFGHLGHAPVVLALSPPTTWVGRRVDDRPPPRNERGAVQGANT